MNYLTSLTGRQRDLPLPKPKVNGTTKVDQTACGTRIKMTVTPEQAKQWLEQRPEFQRNLVEAHWMALAIDMLEGRWRYNPLNGAIGFDANNNLINGQHTLMACAESGVSIEVDVVFGCDPELVGVTDIGMKRTAAHISHMLDRLPNANAVCAIARLLVMQEKHGIQRMNNPKSMPSQTQIRERAKDPLIQEAVRVAATLKKMGSKSMHGFCYCIFADQDKAKADKFFSELATGIGLSGDNPAYLLREKLIDNVNAKAKLPFLHLVALYFRAWSAYREGKRMKILKTWRCDGTSPEDFPRV